MENSIEEDIKIALDKFSDNKDSNSAVLIVEQFILGNYVLVGGRKDIVKNSLRYILSDYKRALKESELLRKDIEGWKKYCEEIEEEQTEMSNRNCELEFEIEKLQKENEELKNKLLDTLEGQKVIKEETPQYIKENFIPVQKIKDKIEKLNDESHAEELEDIMIGKNYTITELVQYVLQELIEESEEK